MMTRLPLAVVLSALLLAPSAGAQTPGGSRPPPAPTVAEPPPPPEDAEPEPEPRGSDLGEQIRDDPPSAQDFAGRLVLVGVGAAVGEVGLGFLGLYLGAQHSLGTGILFAVVGGTLGAGLGAALFGAPGPDTHPYATVGALLGALAGAFAAVPLSIPLNVLVIALPVAFAVVGYAVGFNLGLAQAPTVGRRGGGFRISPVVTFVPGGGSAQVGLAGVF